MQRLKPSKSGPSKTYAAILSIAMTDRDVMEHAAALTKAPKLHEFQPAPPRLMKYSINLSGPKAVGWMMMIYPFMGQRRKAKIREVLDVWKSEAGTSTRGYLCKWRRHRLTTPGSCRECRAAAEEKNRKRCRIVSRHRKYGTIPSERLFG